MSLAHLLPLWNHFHAPVDVMKKNPLSRPTLSPSRTVESEGFVASDVRGLCDQICTTYGPNICSTCGPSISSFSSACAPRALANECGTCKTVRTRIWSWLSGKTVYWFPFRLAAVFQVCSWTLLLHLFLLSRLCPASVTAWSRNVPLSLMVYAH